MKTAVEVLNEYCNLDTQEEIRRKLFADLGLSGTEEQRNIVRAFAMFQKEMGRDWERRYPGTISYIEGRRIKPYPFPYFGEQP